jgi:hypothetical protein
VRLWRQLDAADHQVHPAGLTDAVQLFRSALRRQGREAELLTTDLDATDAAPSARTDLPPS